MQLFAIFFHKYEVRESCRMYWFLKYNYIYEAANQLLVFTETIRQRRT